ncbi:hypothetical protein AJ78_08804 [Emergomyces pasteurianus Ep9510]|uniref:Uncharacterized protein n=1 Tax=Emergomyces pasteurianus Ep9510 TaxID=1447872 RepID=A0A1J9Q168_9EURO|nr:hypothetical protein AJ78_08804 [Emergomyces pasteurianus Ep9510]
MDNRPRSPTPDSGSPYKEPNTALKSSVSYDIFRDRSDTATYNLHDEPSRSPPPAHRSRGVLQSGDSLELGAINNSHDHTPSALVDTQPPLQQRRFCATDYGSPVQKSDAYKDNSGSLTTEHKRHRTLDCRSFDIYTDPGLDADAGAEADAEETSKIPSRQQQLPPAPLCLMDKSNEMNPDLGTRGDGKDNESNKDNILPEATIPLGEGGPPLRRRSKLQRPFGLLNSSDFYPADASTCPNCLRSGVGTVTSNLRMNGDDGDVFLDGSRGAWANSSRFPCSKCWK